MRSWLCPRTGLPSVEMTKTESMCTSPSSPPVQVSTEPESQNTLNGDALVSQQLVGLSMLQRRVEELIKSHQLPEGPLKSTSLLRVRATYVGMKVEKQIQE